MIIYYDVNNDVFRWIYRIFQNEFGPVEYSGTIENGKAVMGIASFEKVPFEIKYDSQLTWTVPAEWSLEDAATVPLAYTLVNVIYLYLGFRFDDKLFIFF